MSTEKKKVHYVNNKEFRPDNSTTEPSDNHPLAHVILFTASWCPYCKNNKLGREAALFLSLKSILTKMYFFSRF